MGLGSLTPDDGNDEDRNPSSSESQRKYERVTYEEFREFLDELPYGFFENDDAGGGERVFESEELLPKDDDKVLRVFSTITKNRESVRDKGTDAIRTVVWSRSLGRPIGGRTKTLRIKTWRKNLKEKIESLFEETEKHVTECPVCDNGYLIEQDGQYGPFLGCTNYPRCTAMVTETKNDNYKGRTSQDADWVYEDTEEEVIKGLNLLSALDD